MEDSRSERLMKKTQFGMLLVCCMLGIAPAYAVVIDGITAGDSYGTAKAIQQVQTGFGDNDGINKGSELDAAYARLQGGKLYVTFTGNLEDNFNKLVVFFDSQSGGQNQLDTDTVNGGTNPPIDPSPYPSDPSMFAKMAGTTFDSGFSADYVLIVRHGFTGIENRLDVDFGALGGSSSQYLGVMNPTIQNSGSTGVGANQFPIDIGFDNSNLAGVGAGTGAAEAGAASVTTGIEIGLDLADLGSPAAGDIIKITAYITNGNHDYVSNQFLGAMPAGTENLGSDGFAPPIFFPNYTYFNLNDFSGDQYFTILVPEPGSMILGSVLLGIISLLRATRQPGFNRRMT
jgi:hypothetical protein